MSELARTELKRSDAVYLGKRISRVDGPEKVAGQAKYYDDVTLPGMLIAKILRSPVSHARILRIDTSKAESMTGVRAVLTGKDIPLRFGFNIVEHFDVEKEKTIPSEEVAALRGLMPEPRPDKPPLAIGKVRYVGDDIAAVAAVDEETAEDALSLIEVEYERLPHVFEPVDAMKEGAPLIHEECPGNIAAHLKGEWGDVEQGFKKADFVFEDTFKTQHQAHCSMETHGCVCNWDGQGNLTVWTSIQVPHMLKREIARALRIPHSRVKILSEYVGGAFGSKTEMGSYHVICAYLAKKTRCPVKLRFTREEEFFASGCRLPFTTTLKTGVTRDGRVTARQVTIVIDKGAYMMQGAAVAFYALTVPMPGLYKPPAYKFDAKIVYTNKLPPTGFRGFGNPQATFAIESQMDIIAEKLDIDPVELRLKNANQPGDLTVSGFQVSSCGLTECIQRAAKAIGWEEKRKNKLPNRGVGLACLFHSSGERGAYGDCDNAIATVKMNDDGSMTLFIGAQELGTGSLTGLTQIAAETLGCRIEDIKAVSGNTDLPTFDLGSYASRSLFISGNAVKAAADNAKNQILKIAAELLTVPAEELDSREGKIFVKSDPNKSLTFKEVAMHAYYGKWKERDMVVGVGSWDAPSTLFDPKIGKWKPPGMAATYTFGCQAVEVEVNPETGNVKVLKVVTAHDVGRVINPTLLEGQLEGAIHQGLGYALTEEIRVEDGKTLVTDFRDYFLRRASDMPPIETILVETNDPYGAYGLKGIGEPAMVPVAPAVANAIYHAIGARVTQLPITRERVIKSLEKND
ncbi:MAG TPA: xanthine dehydrogenase family protein molybdopterin-binding subunit [Candidatus Bathyarchaeia archaeon]|nr:xanthine dehydrogenase family protein molybdopterin-binding subunit [Candidatus Bathyarchaeia archaeon]